MKRNKGHKFISLNERSQPEETIYCMFPTIWHSGKGKTIKTVIKD